MLAVTMATAQRNVVGDFTRSPNEHIINEIDEPFVVRSIRGCVFLDRDQKMPLPGVLFEIQGPGSSKRMRRATTDKSGRFRIPRTPVGTYRFKTTLMSFQSEMGTVIVSKKAPKHAEIRLTVPVGQ